MVSLREPAPPADVKQFFDHRIMPALIDGAACLDIGLVKTCGQIRRNPATALGLAFGSGVLLAAWLGKRATRRP